MKQLAFALGATLVLAACSGQNAEQTTAPAPEPAPAVSDQPEVVTPPKSAAETQADQLAAAINGDWRSPENKARDVFRHPAQTLDFLGAKPDMTVIEMSPGGGWYTEILAPWLSASGHYIGAVAADASSEYASKSNQKLRDKLAAAPEQYGKVHLVEFDPKAPVLGPADSADEVLTFRNVHNWVMAETAPAMFQAFFAVLKPGGTLGVVEHRAAVGSELDKSGYVPEEYVIKLATDAGFKLVDKSEINANPKDTKDYEKGVWTLPPTLTLGDTDREKYQAIGESDRMTLKFVKPKPDRIFEQGADKAPATE